MAFCLSLTVHFVEILKARKLGTIGSLKYYTTKEATSAAEALKQIEDKQNFQKSNNLSDLEKK